jgi:hypothetical protein
MKSTYQAYRSATRCAAGGEGGLNLPYGFVELVQRELVSTPAGIANRNLS